MWKLNKAIINNQRVKEEIMKEIRNFVKTSGNETQWTQTYGIELKQHLTVKSKAVNVYTRRVLAI